jgi:hypothetical protein
MFVGFLCSTFILKGLTHLFHDHFSNIQRFVPVDDYWQYSMARIRQSQRRLSLMLRKFTVRFRQIHPLLTEEPESLKAFTLRRKKPKPNEPVWVISLPIDYAAILRRIESLPFKLRTKIYNHVVGPAERTTHHGWHVMSRPWPFHTFIEGTGNWVWEELQDNFFSHTAFAFVLTPDINFDYLRVLRSKHQDPDNTVHTDREPVPVNVAGIPSSPSIYSHDSWLGRVKHLHVDLHIQDLSNFHSIHYQATKSESELLQTCKTSGYYVAVAKVAWLLRFARSLQDLHITVVVKDGEKLDYTNIDCPTWWSFLKPLKSIPGIKSIHFMNDSMTPRNWSVFEPPPPTHDGMVLCPEPRFGGAIAENWGAYEGPQGG